MLDNIKKKVSNMKVVKKIIKFLLGFVVGLVGVVILILVSLNLIKFALYSDYYGMKENLCINPGLNEGAVPQGIAVDIERDIVLTTAYMADHSSSRIYVTNSKNESRYVILNKNGNEYTGHVGGISLSKDYAYVAEGDTIFPIKLSDIYNKDIIDIGNGIPVNNQASFTFADDNYLYVGEFNYGPYVCDNQIGDYNAICTKYDLNDLTKPLAIYSIPDKVQGFCVTDSGDIVLSCSWSLADSYFYLFEAENIIQSGEYEGVPLYVLKNPSKTIKAPAMSEDLSYSNGKVYTMYENACDKYIYGKFFFGSNKVVALEFE